MYSDIQTRGYSNHGYLYNTKVNQPSNKFDTLQMSWYRHLIFLFYAIIYSIYRIIQYINFVCITYNEPYNFIASCQHLFFSLYIYLFFLYIFNICKVLMNTVNFVKWLIIWYYSPVVLLRLKMRRIFFSCSIERFSYTKQGMHG